jgi:hypothetical protein
MRGGRIEMTATAAEAVERLPEIEAAYLSTGAAHNGGTRPAPPGPTPLP